MQCYAQNSGWSIFGVKWVLGIIENDIQNDIENHEAETKGFPAFGGRPKNGDVENYENE